VTIQALVRSEHLKRIRYNISIKDYIAIPSTKDCIVKKTRIAISHTKDYIAILVEEHLHCDFFCKDWLEEACEIRMRAARFKDNVKQFHWYQEPRVVLQSTPIPTSVL